GTSANNGDYDRASDVWLSYGPDGRLYQVALVFDWFTGRNAITASTSTDDGRTWSTPTVVVSSNGGNSWSKPAVVSDIEAVGTVDPSTGDSVRAADDLFDVADDPSG